MKIALIAIFEFYFYFTMSVPDEGYSTNTIIHTTLAIFVSILWILLWAYLMKVIPQTRHSLYIIYLRFYFYFTMSVPDEGYSTNIIRTTFIRYFYFHSKIKIETTDIFVSNVVRMTCLWNNLHQVRS